MKTAVVAEKPSLFAKVAESFEQAGYIVVYDTESGDFTSYDINEQWAFAFEALVTGAIDRRVLHMFRAAGVVVYTGAKGLVADAIDDLVTGRLGCAINPEPAKV